MSRTLFGTDGIRGVAGEYPLDPATVHATGAALAHWVKKRAQGGEVLIGMDTRESGQALAEQLAGGLASEGVASHFAGLLTTPGVAHLTKNGPFEAGVMISASHNPYQDNGIKVFAHTGYKLPDEVEHEIEQDIFRLAKTNGSAPAAAELRVEKQWDARYLDYLASTLPAGCGPLRIVVDCGHGAASHLAPALFERLGATVDRIGCEPNGRNINLNCGALHVGGLSERVVQTGADLGCAFDGDADRCIFVSSSGRIVDGDMTLFAAGRFLKSRGRLPEAGIVATVMSNLGLQRALDREGIAMVRTPVGDKYVLEKMLLVGAAIGGEQSGHVIFSEWATTGDGLLTAVRILEIMHETGRSLDDLVADFVSYPQTLVNIRVKQKRPLEELPGVRAAVESVEKALGAEGRVLVRFSGTEPLARVMVEGPTEQAVSEHAARIADTIRAELG
jgi:phosphoglucosamine mutase